jgi:hypothetical protein
MYSNECCCLSLLRQPEQVSDVLIGLLNAFLSAECQIMVIE